MLSCRRAGTATALALLCVAANGWAQAEPAPEGYVPPGHEHAPPATTATPATTTPSTTTPAEPEAAEAAEPAEATAPEAASADPNATPDKPPRWNLGVGPSLSFLLGDPPSGVPAVGYGAAVRLHLALWPLGPLRLGAGVHFNYHHLSREKPGVTFGPTTQAVAHASFKALAILDGLFGPARPWVGVGGGFSVPSYEDPSLVQGMPAMAYKIVSVVPVVTLAFGLGVHVVRGFEIGVRCDLDFTFSSQSAGMPRQTLFSPGVVGLTLDLGFRF